MVARTHASPGLRACLRSALLSPLWQQAGMENPQDYPTLIPIFLGIRVSAAAQPTASASPARHCYLLVKKLIFLLSPCASCLS